MSDNLEDFFEESTHWVDGRGNATPVAPPKPPKSRKEMRQRRNRKRRKTLTKVIAAVIIVALVGVGGWFAYGALKSLRERNTSEVTLLEDYEGPGYGSVEFTVAQGDNSVTIAKNLVKAQVIKSEAAFTSLAAGQTLYPGTYDLKKHMAGADVVAILTDQSKAKGFLDVKAGERVSDVIKSAATLSGIDESEFQAIIDAKGAGILPEEAGGNFEGWLEPGSYDVKSASSAQEILKNMVDKRIAKLDALGAPTGAERERLLIIASIAESEVNWAQYYGKVTRVILNRLDQNMTLGMDSTTAYGLGINAGQLTNAQLQDKSNPYNTRVNTGLTPTPISNPGDNAIEAALSPEEGNWLYFVTVNLKTGETKFTDNYDEFLKFRDEYKANNPDAN
ncbi:YceG family protein [Bifidobacterium goeldii]|uniref:Endolytic murein transglycosylase n=1 Tax=Bifidobacterium goeldii TaxID=2306975 RepID=A0A430FMG6_9BIFI|nr:endolytic transglycosylase MltG [Bifidobacterium goeldii]RSX53871.1 YceG family protein [Bifidobacterium goeldii]